jgi:hypothetical protein
MGHLLNEGNGNTGGRSSTSRGLSPRTDDRVHRQHVWMDARLKQRHCPKCRSTEAHRSRRRGRFESHLMAFLPLRPFRCRNCDCRFYAWYFDLHYVRSQIRATRGPQGRHAETP